MSAWKELQLARTDEEIVEREREWRDQCRRDWLSDEWQESHEDEPVCCDECKYWADGICSLSEDETNDDDTCRWGCRMRGADDETD